MRKMTGRPAATVGMVDRGRIAAGMSADVTVFDPATVIDRATFTEPMLPPEGIRFVLVNGRLAVRHGQPTGERAGQTLRRTPHMPTRPMDAGERRTSKWRPSSESGTDHIALDVTQAKGARAAKGTFRLSQQGSGVAFEMKEFGHLQTTTEWASFTGRARLRKSEPERSVTVILDRGELIVSAGDFQFTAGVRR